MKIDHDVKWVDAGYFAQCKPDPEYPDGMDLDLSRGARKVCKVKLAYPARRCGHWSVNCKSCGVMVMVTASGRADDPRSVTIGCKPGEAAKLALMRQSSSKSQTTHSIGGREKIAAHSKRPITLARVPWKE